MQSRLITLLAGQNSYPILLAHEIGIDGAIAISEIIKLCGLSSCSANDLIVRLKSCGLKRPHQTIEDLSILKAITVKENILVTTISVNQEFFSASDDVNIDISESIFTDSEFIVLLTKWKAILVSKGIRKPESEFRKIFENLDQDVAKESLNYSITNRLSTIHVRPAKNRGGSQKNNGPHGSGPNRGSNGGIGGSGSRVEEENGSVHKGLDRID